MIVALVRCRDITFSNKIQKTSKCRDLKQPTSHLISCPWPLQKRDPFLVFSHDKWEWLPRYIFWLLYVLQGKYGWKRGWSYLLGSAYCI
jgi:hypothetical protein